MTAVVHAPIVCEAETKLKQAAFALQRMIGDHVFDLGALANMMKLEECDDHKPAGAERGALLTVPTASSPLSLDPHESYYRPPYTGRD